MDFRILGAIIIITSVFMTSIITFYGFVYLVVGEYSFTQVGISLLIAYAVGAGFCLSGIISIKIQERKDQFS